MTCLSAPITGVLVFPHHSAGFGRKDEAGVQVPRRFRLLHHQDLLDDAPEVPRDRLHPQGEVQQRRARGGRAGQPATPAHPPQSEADAGLPQAHGDGPRLHREVAQLLRGGHGHGERGHPGTPVQPHVTAHGWLRPHVLRPRLQHAPVHQSVAVQL